MTTTTDERSFLARIAANPADDTDRLVYADWLDENPSPDAKCGHCLGEPCRAFFHGATSVFWRRVGVRADVTVYECLACAATGSVPDTSRRERAEFIRDGVEAARCGMEHYQPLDPQATDWRRAGDCPECWGSGTQVSGQPGPACPRCWGSGDVGGLLRAVSAEWNGGGRFDTAVPLRVDFERGFPHRVHCRLEDVARLECPDCGGLGRHGYAECSGEQMWRPAPWALAVVRHHPVTQFRVDLPFNSTDNANAWHKSTIPDFLFDLIQGHDSSAPDAAHTAMAAVLAAWARAFPAGS